MFPNMFCGSFKSHHQRNQKMALKSPEPVANLQFQYSIPYDMDPHNIVVGAVSLKSNKVPNKNAGGIKKMANKVNFSDLIHRVTACCLLHPLGSGHNFTGQISDEHAGEYDSDEKDTNKIEEYYDDEEEDTTGFRKEREMEMVMLMGEVFETVSSMKRAYVGLQEAHCPWDADKMRLYDVAVVGELRKLGVLRERFRRSVGKVDGSGDGIPARRTTVREVVAPYEAAMEKLKMEVKSKEVEIDTLREKLKTAVAGYGSGGRKSRSQSHQSKRKVSCSSQFHGSISPATMAVQELFVMCMSSVEDGSKSFTALLLSLMKTAHWDITAAVKSITGTNAGASDSILGPNQAKYALESYVNRKIFHGFDHETFYMDGSLSSLLNPNQFRSECFRQYSDMKSMDPIELLRILPTCQFGKFCSKKYLSIVHPKMEESLLGDLEQRRQVLAGNHPRSRFYGEFLAMAKAVWLLHLLAFSLDPLPSHFEGSRGLEFHPEYMESAVKYPGGRVVAGHVVGFPVSLGFKLGDGTVVKARVYLVPRSEL